MSLPSYALSQQSFPEMYERLLVGPLFRPWAETLVDRARPAPGERVLDVACGTGIVARVAKARVGESGRVVGVDVSPEMLAVARGVEPGIDWRAGNADALPVDDQAFEIVFCHQGLQFFPDRAQALGEMHRALAHGGRLAVATWQPVDDFPLLVALQQVAERHAGPINDRRHGFGDAGALGDVISRAGLSDVRVEALTKTIRFADPMVFVRLNAMALVGMSASAKSLRDDERAALVASIVAASEPVARTHSDGEGLAYGIGAVIATARK